MPRVLIVDDSATARELIGGILGGHPDIEVVGYAADGEEAVRMTRQLQPDLVTVDIHMPRMNGLEATRNIMSTCPTPIVIVSASTLVNDVQWAMQALQAGALTLLLKPPGPGHQQHDSAARELIETVHAMAGVKVVRRRRSLDLPAPEDAPPPAASSGARIVAVAASTGGPPAIPQVLSALPPDGSAAVLIVQHIAPGFCDGFVSWLDGAVDMQVRAAEQHEPLRGGVAYVAPEGVHLGVTRDGCIQLSKRDPIGGFRPSATHLFHSVAEAYQRDALGVILTGMGDDGVVGLRTIREHGGHVIAQDEESCVVFGMPAAAIRAGVVDATLPLDQIGAAIARRLGKATQGGRPAT